MRLFGNEQRRGFHYEMLAVPWAFLNGLFLGAGYCVMAANSGKADPGIRFFYPLIAGS